MANLKARHENYSTPKFHYSKETEAEKLLLSAESRLILRQVGNHRYATGKLKGDKAWGRPVDALQIPDG